jgi:hypothetical protein
MLRHVRGVTAAASKVLRKGVRYAGEKGECWCFSLRTSALHVNALEDPALWKCARAVMVQDGKAFWDNNERQKEMIEDKATEKLKKRLKDMGLIVNAGADKAKSPKSDGNSTSKIKKGRKK